MARLAGAAGVHVGQDDLSPADARAVVGPHAIVGYSTHTLEQFERALREPVSYLAIGPVFGTSTKNTGYEAVGLALVEAAARQSAGASHRRHRRRDAGERRVRRGPRARGASP